MKYLTIYFSLFILVSCGSHRSELWFYADGSGQRTTTLVVKPEMMKLVYAWQEELKSIDQQEVNKKLSNKKGTNNTSENSEQRLTGFEKILLSSVKGSVDTNLVLYNIVPDSIKGQLDQAQLLKKVAYEIQIDADKNVAKAKFTAKYKNLEEALKINEVLRSMDELEKSNLNLYTDSKKFFNFLASMDYDVENGILKYPETALFKTGLIDEDLINEVDINDEFMFKQYLKFLDIETYELILHLPGKIKKVSGVEYQLLDEDTVVLKFDMAPIIKSKIMPGYEIKF